ncbi:unnamed protein product [Ceutorhynchus assimilis]|uniref:OTU domain-containing protein n=1 Tax=Ceutorhynchus assimilis TaxID=467358 RepID=A0A9N9MBP0_9CUCU|nr:unnamed protein product [Ceutorhynchus assimilis]
MKMEKEKSLGKKSLPGDRQSGFGADAELDSMRDVGGRKLNRRAPVPQEPTADYNLKDNSTQHHGNTIFLRMDIVGDGSCLFRAASQYLHGHQDKHKELRIDALSYIKQHWEEIKFFAFVESQELTLIDNYYSHMIKSSTYGTSLEILALSEILKQLQCRKHRQVDAPFRGQKPPLDLFGTKADAKLARQKESNRIYEAKK